MNRHEKADDDRGPTFEVHPSVLFRLGEELIRDEVQALSELVKNSYDAQARWATVEIQSGHAGPGGLGTITVSDGGTGMTEDILASAFLTLANSPKRAQKENRTVPKGFRWPLGDKGLGRLGAQRLGNHLSVATRPGEAGAVAQSEYRVEIDWRDIANAKRLSDVHFPITRTRLDPPLPCGTDISVSGLHDVRRLVDDHGKLLQRELVRMVSPFGGRRGFVVRVNLDGTPIDLYSLTEQILASAVLKYNISYRNEHLQIEGQFSPRFLSRANTAAEKRAREAIAEDLGAGFVAFLNTRERSAYRFRIGNDSRWPIESSLGVDLADLVPDAVHDSSSPSAGKRPVPPADPGPFRGEVYMVAATELRDSVGPELRTFLRDAGGIRVYRDNFGINLPQDWMGLGQATTSASSSYGLRPGNVLGYVDLTVRGNPNLIEATDREAFVDNPYLRNFNKLFDRFVSWSDGVQNTLRRQLREYGNTLGKPESESRSAEETLSRARQQLTAAGSSSAPGPRPRYPEMGPDESDRSGDRDRTALAGLADDLETVEHELADLREQLILAHEAVAIGLSAEVMSHEVMIVTDRILSETRKFKRRRAARDPSTAAYLSTVEAAARTIAKHLSYLSPALRYRRERRENFAVAPWASEVLGRYSERLLEKGIQTRLTTVNDFSVSAHRGRLTQVLDNLIWNSEYWLENGRGSGRKLIEITIDSPRIRVRDTGPGVSPAVEASLFEPFVTNKPRGSGRGLGLFVARELLTTMGCAIELSSSRNAAGRHDEFVLDLGAIRA